MAGIVGKAALEEKKWSLIEHWVLSVTTQPRHFAIKKRKCLQTWQENIYYYYLQEVILRKSSKAFPRIVEFSCSILLETDLRERTLTRLEWGGWGVLQRMSSFSLAVRLRDGPFSHESQWTCLNPAALPMKPELSSAYCLLCADCGRLTCWTVCPLFFFGFFLCKIKWSSPVWNRQGDNYHYICCRCGNSRPPKALSAITDRNSDRVKKNGAGQ